MTNEIIAHTIDKSIDILGKIFENYKEYKNIQLVNESLLRTYYLETIANIDLIDAVLPKIDNTVKITDEPFRTFINSLQTKVGVSILFSDETQKCKAFKTLIKKTIKKSKALSKQIEDGKQYRRKINLLSAMMFIISKVEFLKTLPEHNIDELLHDFQLHRRLTNIKESMLAVKKIMEETILRK